MDTGSGNYPAFVTLLAARNVTEQTGSLPGLAMATHQVATHTGAYEEIIHFTF